MRSLFLVKNIVSFFWSVFGGVTYAVVDSFDTAYSIRHDIRIGLDQNVPLAILMNSEKLFKMFVKFSTLVDKRLMIDMRANTKAKKRVIIPRTG